MTLKLAFAAIAAAAGVAASLQAASNAGLAGRIGLSSALVVNTSIVMAATLAFWILRGARTEFFPEGAAWPCYLGGVFGFVIIACMAFVFPKLGGAMAISLMVMGQGLAALAIDHFGLMGMPKDPVTLTRLAGVALVAVGVVLLRH